MNGILRRRHLRESTLPKIPTLYKSSESSPKARPGFWGLAASGCGKSIRLHPQTAIFLLVAGALGGALNAVAGGGSFIAFPALLFSGVPPIPANATNTFALWMGVLASGGAYRKRLKVARRILVPLLVAGFAGGLGGAVLLIHTPAETFLKVLPWLLLGATLLFAFGQKLTKRLREKVFHEATTAAIVVATVFELAVAVYGGYFGGGIGIMNLAMLAVLGMTDIHEMNALKVVLGGTINGIATLTFVVSHAVVWPQGITMTAGALCGGYLSAHYAQKVPQTWTRGFVVAVGSGMTAYFFWRGYR